MYGGGVSRGAYKVKAVVPSPQETRESILKIITNATKQSE